MGRVHKKKLAEYAEAAEDEEQLNKSTDKETEEEEEEIGSRDEGGNVSEIEGEAQDAATAATNAENDEEDEFKSLQGDNAAESGEENGSVTAGRKANKRKATEKSGKKSTADAGDASSDDEPLNGSGASGVAAKKPRKAAGKAKATKGAAKAGKHGGRANAKKNAEKASGNNSVEEEYEVKDIIDHKVERGVSHFLIRWKGYTKDDDTWEPEDTLSCPDLIEKYRKKQAANGGKLPKKGGSPGKRGRPTGKVAGKADPEKEWEVEKIIDYSEEKDGRVFRIRWKGFGSRFDTWEPEKNLFCDDIIKKFMQRMKSQSNITFKELRQEPKKTKRLVNENLPRTNYRNPIGRTSKRAVSKKRIYYGDSDE